MEETVQKHHLIMALPAEVRGSIYNNLTQKEALDVRLVCKQWAEEVKIFFEFSTQLDQRKAKQMKTLRNLKIRKCEVTCLRQLLSTPISTTFFKYPKFLRHLTINSKNLSLFNFHHLMREFSQHLNTLIIHLDVSRNRKPALWIYHSPSDSQYNFGNLREFVLLDSRKLAQYELPELEFEKDIFFQFLRNPSISNLKSLELSTSIAYNSNQTIVSKISAEIFSLMARQWKTLQTVRMLYGEDVMYKASRMHSQLVNLVYMTLLRERMDSMKEIELYGGDSGVRNLELVEIVSNFWSDCLRRQKSLKSLKIFRKDSKIQYPLFLKVVVTNFATLSEVNVVLTFKWFKGHTRKGPLDMSIFKICGSLKQLSLRLEEEESRTSRLQRDIVNLVELPKSIETLRLEAFGMSTKVLDDFVSQGQELESLKSLRLMHCGIAGEFGVNGSFLERVVGLHGILDIAITASLGFDISKDGELEKVKAVFKRFDHEYEPSFDISFFVIRESIYLPFNIDNTKEMCHELINL